MLARRQRTVNEEPGMNVIVRASIMAAALLPAGLMPAPSRAEQCRIGPVLFEAPACTVENTDHREGPAQYAEWREGGRVYTVLVVTARKRDPLKGYLARWLHHRKCIAKEIPFGHEVRFEGSEDASKTVTPPQITWTGACIVAGTYFVRAIGLKHRVVELHVRRGVHDEPPPIETALAAFLDRVRLSPASRE